MPYKYNPPAGWPPENSRGMIRDEIRKWNEQAGAVVISDYDLPMMRPGVKVAEFVFLLRGAKTAIRIDRWDDFGTNLRAVALNFRDMRLAEARGGLEAMRETLLALPAAPTKRSPWEILEVAPGTSLLVAEAAYKALIAQAHPDRGGENGRAAELNDAIAAIRAAAREGAPK